MQSSFLLAEEHLMDNKHSICRLKYSHNNQREKAKIVFSFFIISTFTFD